jgi:hypothetical protein
MTADTRGQWQVRMLRMEATQGEIRCTAMPKCCTQAPLSCLAKAHAKPHKHVHG